MARLDHDGATPLYLQVKSWVEEQIATGRFRPHRRVPSERNLSERFGVSRMTVRQALAEMVRDGELYAKVGAGTFVADPVIRQPLGDVGVAGPGRIDGESIRMLRVERVRPPPAVRAALGLGPSREVVMMRRLHHSNEQPLMVETVFLGQQLGESLPTDLEPGTFAALVDRNRLEAEVTAEHEAAARRARPQEVGLLRIDEETAVFEITRIGRNAAGDPVEYAAMVYRGDRYRFGFRTEQGGGESTIVV